MARRTAKFMNASSNASLRLGIRCVRFSSVSRAVSTTTRLRPFATAASLAVVPAVKNDMTKMTSSSIISRISSAMICHLDSVMFIDVSVRPSPMVFSWSENSRRWLVPPLSIKSLIDWR